MFQASCSSRSSFYGCILLVCIFTHIATAKSPRRCFCAGELRKGPDIFRS